MEGEDLLSHGVAAQPSDVAEVEVYSAAPRVAGLRRFVTVDELDAVKRLGRSWRGQSSEDSTGRHFEMAYESEIDGYSGRSNFRRAGEGEPSRRSDLRRVQGLVSRLDALILGPELRNMMGGSLRVRRYVEGQGHPPHVDSYNNDESILLVTAMLIMRPAVRGGATRFTKAGKNKNGIDINWDLGEIAVWWSCDPKGRDDETAEHLGASVKKGYKWTATYFLYHNDPKAVCGNSLWRNVFGKGNGFKGPLNWTMPSEHSTEL